MDTKSKNNQTNKPGIIIAAVLVLAAAVSFLSLYPYFDRQASLYASRHEEDVMCTEEFLRELYKGTLVLYKELSEQESGNSLRYQDIYLSAVTEHDNQGDQYYTFNEETPEDYAGRCMDELLAYWESHMWEGLHEAVDYQIKDSGSGKTFSNTDRNLELLGSSEAPEEVSSHYPYYVKMRFDDSGALEHVWVSGADVDSLLKNVKRVMRGRHLERELYQNMDNSPYGDCSWEQEIYYIRYGEFLSTQLYVSNTPRNCTVCYALTQEQKDSLKNSGMDLVISDPEAYYYHSAVADCFRLFLLVLGLLALLLPRVKAYHLHEMWIFDLHLEILLSVLFVIFSFLGELISLLVQAAMSSQGNYRSARIAALLQAYLPALSAREMQILIMALNLVALVVCFGLWYLLVTALGQIHIHGFVGYLKKRSLIWRLFAGIRRTGRQKTQAFKDELLHVDIGQNMNRVLVKALVINYLLLALLSMLWIAGVLILIPYTALLYWALKKYIRRIQAQYQHLLTATQSIAEGNLQTEFTGDWGVFESYKKELQEIQTGFSRAVEEEVKSQRMRTELITNVSHDLKTPLTAITTYIELLQEENVTEEKRREYLDVLSRKAARLKTLIEDLFEVSKANSGSVTFRQDKVDICSLLRQVYLEYEDKVEAADLLFRFQMPEEKVFLLLDSEKTCRIFENLYINIIKYAMPHTRVYVQVERQEETVTIVLKNMSMTELQVAPESLTERFVRGDSSRNTEGSGLGLAIARSFVEMQKGKMQVEVDGDLFKVTIVWKGIPASNTPPQAAT